jgi:hypothetical protein
MEKRSLYGVSSFGPHRFKGLPFFSLSLRRLLAMRSIMMVVRVSGTKKKCTTWVAAPKISWIQMFQRHARNCSTKPPTTGPKIEPPTEEKTMKATAYCWLSASHISATIPSVTEPPAVERPPSARKARMVPKLGATPTGICQIFTKNKLSWRMGHRPSSSLQGCTGSALPKEKDGWDTYRPQLTTKRVCNQEDCGTQSPSLCANPEFLGYARNRIRV